MFPKIFLSALPMALLAAACSRPPAVVRTETHEYVLSDSSNATADPMSETRIRPYRDSMTTKMSTVLAVSSTAMEKGQPEGLLGNFFSDACLHVASAAYYPSDGRGIDFAFFNNGGLRASLPKGEITRRNIFELMPFDNELVVVTLDSGRAKKVFNFIASKDGVPVSGVRMELKDKVPFNIAINGQPFDSNKVYKAVTSDYLANGGDQYFFLADAKREVLNLRIRDALEQYLLDQSRDGKTIGTKLDQRIRYVK